MDKMLMPATIELDRIWEDQADFNRLFRRPEEFTFEQRTAETKELVLHLISEADELLRASGAWKFHRRVPVRENKRAVGYELADLFKYVMSVAQVHGITIEEFVQFYWEKSMVVRQRYAQEFVQTLDQPAMVVDIDNVLADYIRGFIVWLGEAKIIPTDVAADFYEHPRYVSARSLGLPEHLYDEAKHLYRISGQHAYIPSMYGAAQFLIRMQQARPDRSIILLTARPIDRYPNLYGETLAWIQQVGLPCHFVWWASDKGEAIRTSGIANHVELAIDDDWTHVEQFGRIGVTTYWLNHSGECNIMETMKMDLLSNVRMVRNFDDILAYEGVS